MKRGGAQRREKQRENKGYKVVVVCVGGIQKPGFPHFRMEFDQVLKVNTPCFHRNVVHLPICLFALLSVF